ncbi:hypothetical protein COY27_00985 [Candidatus Woesearchaeota archaeon CG_4_10_14_0_2_um_filter_33_13]|nr:MAG: hypothetical protein COY27_00985 [Candidatus Woesearchaeota archaeon CG_4_10_14_0_2_um_filter_33_13]
MPELTYNLGLCIGEGTFSQVYDLPERPEFILKMLDSKVRSVAPSTNLRMLDEIMRRQELIPSSVSLSRIVEVGTKDGYVAVVIQRAPGEELFDVGISYSEWKARIAELAGVNRAIYKKAVSDAGLIMSARLAIDLCPKNLFYDPKQGFTFIDVNPGYQVPSLQIPFLLYPVVKSSETHFKDKEDELNLEIIRKKLICANDFDPNLIKF